MDTGITYYLSLFGSTSLIFSCVFSTVTNSVAMYVIFFNPRLSKLVRYFSMCDQGTRVLDSLIYAAFCMPIVLFSLASTQQFQSHAFDVYALPSKLIASLYLSNQAVTTITHGCISINRYFAIAYDGKYYKRAKPGILKYTGVNIAIPYILTFTILAIPGSYAFFDDQECDFRVVNNDKISTVNVTLQDFLLFAFGAISVVLDIKVLLNIRRRSRQRNSSVKFEKRLAIQVLFTHLVEIGNVLFGFIVDFAAKFIFGVEQVECSTYLLTTAFQLFMEGMIGINSIVFLRSKDNWPGKCCRVRPAIQEISRKLKLSA